jgi:Zn-dependent protease with chaperone function
VDPVGNSFADREGFLGDLFASHPPIAQRVIRLKGMAYQAAKQVTVGQQL